MTALEEPKGSKWAFWSTRESIDNDVPSITAIVETIIAIPLYWWIASHFETYLLLLVGSAVAPLVLLRSDESVARGVKWFLAWERRWNVDQIYGDLAPNQRRQFWIVVMLATLLAVVGSFLLASHLLLATETSLIIWSGFAIGRAPLAIAGVLTLEAAGVLTTLFVGAVGRRASSPTVVGALALVVLVTVAGAVAGVVAGEGAGNGASLFFLPLALGVVLSSYIVSLIVRVGATLRHLGPGVRSLPRNFRRLILCTSPRQDPEMVPGLPPDQSAFSWTAVWRGFHEDRRSGTLLGLMFAFFFWPQVIFLWFVPGWLYRITLKSTAWFWWPLAYLGGNLGRATNPGEFRRTTMGSLWALASIATAIVTIGGFLWINFVRTGAVFQDNPLLTIIGYTLLVDWSLPPWQVLTVALAILSIMIVFLVDDAEGQHRLAAAQRDDVLRARAATKLCWAEYMTRFRFLLLVSFLLISGSQALLYLNSLKCSFEVPASIERKAQWLYGDRMPKLCSRKGLEDRISSNGQ